MKVSLRILQLSGELAGCQHAFTNRLDEIGRLFEGIGRLRVGVQDTHRQVEFLPDDADRLNQIGIIRNQDGNLIKALVPIVDQMGGNIHIGAFFFSFDDTHKLRVVGRTARPEHGHFMLQKMTVYDFQVREGAQSAQIDLLASGLSGITRTGRDQRSEIFDLENLVFREQSLRKPGDIQPFVRGVFNRPIVQIETIHVKASFHLPAWLHTLSGFCCKNTLVKKAEAAVGRLAPCSRRKRGDTTIV